MRHKQDKQTKELADELAALAVFAELDRRSIDGLAEAGRVVHLPAAWAMVAEAQPADSCYVVLGGTAQVRQHGVVIAELNAGSLVGEAALVEHRTRNATVVTTSEVRALRLGFGDLEAVFAKHPAIETVFAAEWARRSAEH